MKNEILDQPLNLQPKIRSPHFIYIENLIIGTSFLGFIFCQYKSCEFHFNIWDDPMAKWAFLWHSLMLVFLCFTPSSYIRKWQVFSENYDMHSNLEGFKMIRGKLYDHLLSPSRFWISGFIFFSFLFCIDDFEFSTFSYIIFCFISLVLGPVSWGFGKGLEKKLGHINGS